jgi:type IV pilus assembly protein PilC
MNESAAKPGRILGPDEVSAFCLQLSYPVQSGISPVDCIGLMLEETDVKREKEILQPVYQLLLEGAPLPRALADAGCFPDYMIQMMEIGQSSGNLDRVLAGLVEYYRKEADTAAGIKRAAVEPAVMLAVTSVLLLVLVIKVLPVFQQVFMQLGGQLSPFAAALAGASDVIRLVIPVVGVALLILAAALFVTLRSESSATKITGVADKLFFRGKLGLSIARARFAAALSLTASSGMMLDECLGKAEGLLADTVLKEPVAVCRQSLAQGSSFPEAVQKAGIFAGIEIGILKAGFKAGAFDKAISELAARFERESQALIEAFIMKIEPTLIIVLSVTVGLALLSVMLPLIGMLSSIGM